MTPETAMESHEASAAPAPGVARTPIEWSHNPWRQNPRAAIFAIVFLFFMGGVMHQLGLATLNSTILWIALLFSIHPVFAIQRCRVDDLGVARRMLFVWDRRPWDRIRRAKLSPAGLVVYPSAQPSALDVAFRGLWLPLLQVPDERRADLLAALRRHLGEHGL